MVLPIPRHHATRGFARQRVEHGACKLPEPCHLDFRAWRVVNGAANLAAPFSPSLPVTGVRRWHPVPSLASSSIHGGANCAPPFESRSRAGRRGWKFSGPVGAWCRWCRIGTPVGSVTVWLVLAALPVDKSAYSTSTPPPDTRCSGCAVVPDLHDLHAAHHHDHDRTTPDRCRRTARRTPRAA